MRKGEYGESLVVAILSQLPNDEYLTLNDVRIRDKYGIHQIDHVVISRYGIFVIETKEYHGVIKGDEYDKQWLQYTFNDKRYVLNPISQNYGHIKALSACLDLPLNYFINIICLTSAYAVEVHNNGELTRHFNLLDKIYFYKDVIINENVFDIRKKIIINNNSITYEEDYNHKLYVKTKQLEQKFKCPKCGGYLIKRNGPYGEFLGCSNYPKCKYIKK